MLSRFVGFRSVVVARPCDGQRGIAHYRSNGHEELYPGLSALHMPQGQPGLCDTALLKVRAEISFTPSVGLSAVPPLLDSGLPPARLRQLEERLGVRLLARTTRSVSPTESGEHLLRVVAPRFEEFNSELGLLSKYRDKPAGKLRITAGEHSAITILQPALAKLLPDNPDLNIEIIVDYGLIDIVAEGYDAGVRLGEQVAKDMIAVRIGPDLQMAVVGSPEYFARLRNPGSRAISCNTTASTFGCRLTAESFPGSSRRRGRS